MLTTTRLNLIIADDHPIFRTGLKKVLKGSSYLSEITLVNNGKEVIDHLEEKHYDVVLMDIRMKPMNGIETTLIVSKRFPSTKVIAFTINDDQESVVSMIKNGAYGYLLKNADKEEIILALKCVSNGKKYFSNEISYVLANKVLDPTPNQKDNRELDSERIRDVLYLMCHELSNFEIADVMYLSNRTIEYYRKKIALLTDSRNYVGVMKYAFNKGILNDVKLNEKWEKVLTKKFNIN